MHTGYRLYMVLSAHHPLPLLQGTGSTQRVHILALPVLTGGCFDLVTVHEREEVGDRELEHGGPPPHVSVLSLFPTSRS